MRDGIVSPQPGTPEDRRRNREALAETEAEIAMLAADTGATITALIHTHQSRRHGGAPRERDAVLFAAVSAGMDAGTEAALVRLNTLRVLAGIMREHLHEHAPEA